MGVTTHDAMDAVIREKRHALLQGFDLRGKRGLEIGPLCFPLATRPECDVIYVDHCTTEQLLEKYKGHSNIDPQKIVNVDFVWGERGLREVVPRGVEYIIASHVVEHVPDLVGWLIEMSDCLVEGGELALVVPDKRFTFDVYRRCAALDEIRLAHAELRRRPGFRCVLDHFCNVVSADAWALWSDYSSVKGLKFNNPPELAELAAREHGQGKYIDVHCWVFTPWHFLEVLGVLIEEFSLPFELCHFKTTPKFNLEFYVRLRKGAPRTDWMAAVSAAREAALWPEPRALAVEYAA